MARITVTGCRSSVDRSPGLTPAVPRRRFHPPSSSRGFTSVHPLPKLPVEFFSSKSLHFISKGRNVPVPPTSCGRRRPRPLAPGCACGHAQRSLPGAANPSKQRGGNGAQTEGGGAQGGLGVRTSGPTTAPHGRLASSAVPFPRPCSRRRPEPAALPPLAALAAALPLCRAGGPWLPRGPPEAGLHSPGRAGGLRGYEPTPAEGRAASRQSWRTCQATLAARSRPTSRARARGLGALKVCGARCGTRRQRGWVRRRLGVSSPRGDHLVSPRQFWEGY